jgi:hypothetical protein
VQVKIHSELMREVITIPESLDGPARVSVLIQLQAIKERA